MKKTRKRFSRQKVSSSQSRIIQFGVVFFMIVVIALVAYVVKFYT